MFWALILSPSFRPVYFPVLPSEFRRREGMPCVILLTPVLPHFIFLDSPYSDRTLACVGTFCNSPPFSTYFSPPPPLLLLGVPTGQSYYPSLSFLFSSVLASPSRHGYILCSVCSRYSIAFFVWLPSWKPWLRSVCNCPCHYPIALPLFCFERYNDQLYRVRVRGAVLWAIDLGYLDIFE